RKQLDLLCLIDLDEGQRERAAGICQRKRFRESEEVLVKGAGFLDVAEAERRIRNPQDAWRCRQRAGDDGCKEHIRISFMLIESSTRRVARREGTPSVCEGAAWCPRSYPPHERRRS